MLSCLAYDALLVKTLLMLGVNHEIVHTEGELFQSLKDLLFASALRNLSIDQFVRKLLTGFIVLAEPLENRLVPDPVLQHLAGQLNEVALEAYTIQPVIVRARANAMHEVAELVEERLDIQMLQIIFENCHHVWNCFLVVFADIAAVHEAADVGAARLLVLSSVIVEVKLTQ